MGIEVRRRTGRRRGAAALSLALCVTAAACADNSAAAPTGPPTSIRQLNAQPADRTTTTAATDTLSMDGMDGMQMQMDHDMSDMPATNAPLQSQDRAALGDDIISDIPSSQVKVADNGTGLYGWGAWQPAQMNRRLVDGTSETPMTPERRKVLADQLERARAAALEVGTVREAEAAGYVKTHEFVNGRGLEYVNFEYADDKFDIDHPEILDFPDDHPDTGIAAIAYYVRLPPDQGPPPDLPLEQIPWHYHWAICKVGDQYPISQTPEKCAAMGGTIVPGGDGWMVDLWIVPGWENPWGLISSKHPDLVVKG